MKNVSTKLSPDGLPLVGIYKRVSSLEQALEGHSLESQEHACRKYLDNLYGAGNYISKVFADEGFSGKLGFSRPGYRSSKTRPALSALVQAISKSEITVVICWRLDRLGRKAKVWHDFLNDYVLPKEIKLISVTEGIDMSTPMGRFAAGNLALAAELFSDITGENVQAAMQRRREDGYPTGQIGYGWMRDGGVISNG